MTQIPTVPPASIVTPTNPLRRQLLLGVSGFAVSAAAWSQAPTGATQALQTSAIEPSMTLVKRVFAALARLGEPFAPADIDAVLKLEATGDLHAASAAAFKLLQSRVLLDVAINPEARVSVTRARDGVALVQGGWRMFLVHIDNPALVPGKLGVFSPSAIPVNGVYPPGSHSGGSMGDPGVATTQGDIAERWLDLDVNDEAPLDANLEAAATDYKIVRLYARDAGRRSALIRIDIGPGTGNLGERDQVSVNFAIAPAQQVALHIRDADGKPVTCSLLITDAQGRVVPSQTRRSPPDMFFQKKVYRADGESLLLPAGDYQVEIGRGPEYLTTRSQRRIEAVGANRWDVQLERWIDPGARGWYSGDHHIHAAGCAHYMHPEEGVGPEMMAPQVKGEGLAIGAVLTWGPGFYSQKKHFSGRDDAVSTPAHILHYDLEVSGFPSSHCGHLALLQMKGMDYPGTERIEQWPSSNAPVLRWARAQGAITGYAHAGVGLWANTTELPNQAMPPFNGIGANDYIVTLPEGLVDFISVCNHPPAAEMNIWYHTLNVGLRSTIAGETDWPCFFEESMGMGRSYVKLDHGLSYAGWCTGLKAGRSYVSEGRAHLFDFKVQADRATSHVGGADLKLATSRPIKISAQIAARLEPEVSATTEAIRKLGPMDKPYWHIERTRIGDTRQVLLELIVNGLAVEAHPILADGQVREVEFDYTPSASCWVALRILNAAHTNPIFVDVGGAPIRIKRSAQWCRAAVDQCWSQKSLRIRESELPAEAALYDRARRFYDKMLAEANA